MDFVIKEENLKDLVKDIGYSICSNKITVEGMKVGYMYREEPMDEEDSGWRFLSGTEDEEYIENPDNSKFFGVNAIANHDPAIIPYLSSPYNSEFEREGDKFVKLVD